MQQARLEIMSCRTIPPGNRSQSHGLSIFQMRSSRNTIVCPAHECTIYWQEITSILIVLECRCYMGLFPEIERAWITVDHRLFLWDYQDGRVRSIARKCVPDAYFLQIWLHVLRGNSGYNRRCRPSSAETRGLYRQHNAFTRAFNTSSGTSHRSFLHPSSAKPNGQSVF